MTNSEFGRDKPTYIRIATASTNSWNCSNERLGRVAALWEDDKHR